MRHLWNSSDNSIMMAFRGGRRRRRRHTGRTKGENGGEKIGVEKRGQVCVGTTLNTHKIMYSITKSFHSRAPASHQHYASHSLRTKKETENDIKNI